MTVMDSLRTLIGQADLQDDLHQCGGLRREPSVPCERTDIRGPAVERIATGRSKGALVHTKEALFSTMPLAHYLANCFPKSLDSLLLVGDVEIVVRFLLPSCSQASRRRIMAAC